MGGWGRGDGRDGSDIKSHILYLDIVVSLQIGSIHAIIRFLYKLCTFIHLWMCWWVGDGRGGSDITSHILYLDIVVNL